MNQLIVSINLVLALALGTNAWARSQSDAGAWTAADGERKDGLLQVSLQADGDGNMGMGIGRTEFSGLTAEQVASDARVPVHFHFAREAGTITFDGTFRGGRGGGDYTFAGNPAYLAALERLGVRSGKDDRDLLTLTLFDVSTEYIRSMQAIGYKEDLDTYVSFRIFHVDPAYVREMSAAGFPNLDADELVQTKVHDVSPEYIKQMRASGESLTLDELVQSRIFEVTPEFASEMAKVGYKDLDREMLVQFRIHGVSPEFVREIRKLGYADVEPGQLVAMRIHGVTPEFIRRVEAAGYKGVPIDKLVQMRIFDIDPEMVGALDKQN